MGCNCEPKRYNMSLGCCTPVLGPIENYYTKSQTDRVIEEAISGITGSTGCCITPEEVDEKINEATSGITEALTEKQDTLIPGDNITIVNNVISATGSGGIDSGTVQSMIDESISGKADTSAVTASLLEKVNIVDNEVPDYYITETTPYTRYYPAQNEHAAYSGASPSMNASFYRHYGYDDTYITIEVINEQGETVSGSTGVDSTSQFTSSNVVPSELANYVTATVDLSYGDHYPKIDYSTTNGWKISYAEMYKVDDDYGDVSSITINIPTPSKLYDGGQSEDVIENVIEPELVRLSNEVDAIPTYSAGTNVSINNNVISAYDTKYSAGDGISINHINVISTTTKFWCGTQAQYDLISYKDPNTVYMIHN